MNAAPVKWENGVFLAPQVFQQSERYLEAQLRFLRRSSRALSFGVLELELDPAALALGKLKLQACQAVLPASDGTAVDVPLCDSAPPERDFSIPSGVQVLEVFLTLPALNAPGRTSARTHVVTDAYDSNRTRTVTVVEKVLALAVSGEVLTNQTALKIAEIERDPQTSKPAQRQGYIPTCLVISAAPGLLNLVRSVLDRAEGLLPGLSAARKQGRQDDFAFLHVLQQHVPVLRHLLEDAAEHTHPVQLYEGLLRMAAALQAFADTPVAWPRYDHGRLDQCFPRLCELTEALLRCRPVDDDKVYILSRKSRDTSTWRGRLEGLPSGDGMVLLALRGDLPAAPLVGRIIKELPDLGKIAAAAKIIRTIDDSTLAIPFQHETRLPERILAQPGIYFSIQVGHELFAEVRKTGEIGVYIPEDLLGGKDPSVSIIYVSPDGSR